MLKEIEGYFWYDEITKIPHYKKEELSKVVGTLKATITYPKSYLKVSIVAVRLWTKISAYLLSAFTKSISSIKIKRFWNNEEASTIARGLD